MSFLTVRGTVQFQRYECVRKIGNRAWMKSEARTKLRTGELFLVEACEEFQFHSREQSSRTEKAHSYLHDVRRIVFSHGRRFCV